MRYIPVHIKTGRRYPAISAEERTKLWSKEPYRSKFRFEEVKEAAAEPKEAKKAVEEQKEGTNPPKG